MKFILFNVVVAAGLFFLLTGTDSPVLSTGPGVFSDAVLKASELGDKVAQRLAHVGPSESPEIPAPAKANPPARNADQETFPPPPAPAPKQVVTTNPPPFPPAIEVAPRKINAVPGDADVAAIADDLDADVRQRRAEVLGEVKRKPRVTVEEGGKLMNPAERRRELDALVEQMELLYIGQIGA